MFYKLMKRPIKSQKFGRKLHQNYKKLANISKIIESQ